MSPAALRRHREQLADCCDDAYSFDFYGRFEWRRAARLLGARGFTDQQILAVLRSKWMRWARDMASAERGTAEHLAAFLDDPRNKAAQRLPALVAAMFGTEGGPR